MYRDSVFCVALRTVPEPAAANVKSMRVHVSGPRANFDALPASIKIYHIPGMVNIIETYPVTFVGKPLIAMASASRHSRKAEPCLGQRESAWHGSHCSAAVGVVADARRLVMLRSDVASRLMSRAQTGKARRSKCKRCAARRPRFVHPRRVRWLSRRRRCPRRSRRRCWVGGTVQIRCRAPHRR